MTLPDRIGLSKPRRRGLYGPFIVAFGGALVLSVYWFWLAGQVTARMDGGALRWASMGGKVHWRNRHVSGFPFRLFVTLNDVDLTGPAGWGASAPVIKAEASVFSTGLWVVSAPLGGTFSQSPWDKVSVRGEVLRASASNMDAHPPSLSVEGLNLSFTTPPGARLFALRTVREFHFHSKAGPSDQGAVYFSYDGVGAAGRPVHAVVDGIFTHAAALKGGDWRSAVAAWQTAGGTLSPRH